MKTARLSTATLTFREGVLIIELAPDVEIGGKEAKEQLRAAKKLVGEVKAPVIIIDNHPSTQTTNEAREILSKGPGNTLRTAEAFVISTLPKRVMVNFYIRFHKPKNPTKVFGNFNQAWNWALGFVKEN